MTGMDLWMEGAGMETRKSAWSLTLGDPRVFSEKLLCGLWNLPLLRRRLKPGVLIFSGSVGAFLLSPVPSFGCD